MYLSLKIQTLICVLRLFYIYKLACAMLCTKLTFSTPSANYDKIENVDRPKNIYE